MRKVGVSIFHAKAIRVAANWFHLPEKKTPQRGHSRFFEHPSSPKGAPALRGVKGRPVEMSAPECHIESDDCLLDPRLIDLSRQCPRCPWRGRWCARLFARRQRTSISAYFTNLLTTPTGLGLLASPSRRGLSRSSSVGLGRSQKDGLPSCREAGLYSAVQGHRLARRGAAWSLPLSSGAGMDAKTRDLALLIVLSLFCAGFAWILDYLRCSRSRHSLEAVPLTWTHASG